MISACFISLALVLGEFTLASLLNRTNLQTSILLVSQEDARFATALALVAIVIGFVLLLRAVLLQPVAFDRSGRAVKGYR